MLQKTPIKTPKPASTITKIKGSKVRKFNQTRARRINYISKSYKIIFLPDITTSICGKMVY